MLEHARAINARLNAARADIEQLEEDRGRRSSHRHVPERFADTAPRRGARSEGGRHCRSRCATTSNSSTTSTCFGSGELDVAFVLLPVDDESIETIELLRDPWVLVVRTDHPLVWKQRPATADDISNLPLITFEQVRPQKLIEGSLRAAGAHVRVSRGWATTRRSCRWSLRGSAVGSCLGWRSRRRPAAARLAGSAVPAARRPASAADRAGLEPPRTGDEQVRRVGGARGRRRARRLLSAVECDSWPNRIGPDFALGVTSSVGETRQRPPCFHVHLRKGT